MRLNTETQEVEVSGFQSTGFGIAVDDPAIIEILTQKIYTDPFVFPRELIANANDSTGVHLLELPDRFNPEWIVEDKGPGMTHEFMLSDYTMIFKSTKRDSNAMIGGFGHGRLSPMAYADSYNVRSRYLNPADGKVWEGNYIVYRSENKIPMITPVSHEVSEVQETGVRVTIPVGDKDINTINQRTRYYASYSEKPVPNMTPVKYIWKCEHGGLREPSSDVGGENQVIMGGVPYVIKPEHLSGGDSYHHRGTPQQWDIFLDIGDVDVTLSRDTINATPDALKKLRAKFNLCVAEMAKTYKAEYDALTTEVAKALYVKKFNNSSSIPYHVRAQLTKAVPDLGNVYRDMKMTDMLDPKSKDLNIHFLTSDIDKTAWEDLTMKEKRVRSLNALRVFTLNDHPAHHISGGVWSEKSFSTSDLLGRNFDYNTSRIQVSDIGDYLKKVTTVFAVPFPYTTGQIKTIKDQVATYLAGITNADKEMRVVLIQYTDKKDVEYFCKRIDDSVKPQYIDVSALPQAGVKYMAVLECAIAKNRYGYGHNFRRKSITETVAKTVEGYYFLDTEATNDRASNVLGNLESLADGPFPEGTKIYKLTAKQQPYFTKLKSLKEFVIQSIEKHYGYPYEPSTFSSNSAVSDAQKNDRTYRKLSQVLNNLRLEIGDIGERHKKGKTLLEFIEEQNKPTLKPILDLLKDYQKNVSDGQQAQAVMATLEAKRRAIESFTSTSYGVKAFLDKTELPKPTKTVQQAQAVGSAAASSVKKLVDGFLPLAYGQANSHASYENGYRVFPEDASQFVEALVKINA